MQQDRSQADPVSLLSYPQHGNQTGVFIDGVFAGVGSFLVKFTGHFYLPLSAIAIGRSLPI